MLCSVKFSMRMDYLSSKYVLTYTMFVGPRKHEKRFLETEIILLSFLPVNDLRYIITTERYFYL